MVSDSNNETNFPHKLLTDTQVSDIGKTFANDSSANIKLSKTQLSKMIQLGGSFLKSVWNYPENLFSAGLKQIREVGNAVKKTYQCMLNYGFYR